MDIIVGTAGHIDHGKTALVKALTGTDTDRLPEEKQRGITIDLGFAECEIDGTHFGFVDVPGHERFVKNMLAGASGIDLVLFVIAADEGIMPQTREHFDICRLLRVEKGVVALTKADLVDDEMLEIVRHETEELVRGSFLNSAPVISVSSKTREGINDVAAALSSVGRAVRPRSIDVIGRLPIDRSFSMKGFGTVVTGTLASGHLTEGMELELLPRNRRVRVRGIQTHGRKVSEAGPGRRTAVNLAGIDQSEVARGMLLADPGVLKPAQVFDCEVEVLPGAPRPLRSRQRIRFHIGTAEVLARVHVIGESDEIGPGKSGFIQFRLESPAAAILGERFIVRSYSPPMTIAGGSVVRPATEKFRRRNAVDYLRALNALRSAENKTDILQRLIIDSMTQGVTFSEIGAITGWNRTTASDAAGGLLRDRKVIDCNGVFLDVTTFGSLASRTSAEIDKLHKADTLSRGVAIDVIRERVFKHVRPEVERAVFADLVSKGQLVIDGDILRLAGFESKLSPAESKTLDHLRSIYAEAGLEVPKTEDALDETAKITGVMPTIVRKLFQQLTDSAQLVRINNEFCFDRTVMDKLIEKVRAFAETSPDRTIDVPKFKELAGVSRKFAIPLLEYFDQQRVTARRGDKRLII